MLSGRGSLIFVPSLNPVAMHIAFLRAALFLFTALALSGCMADLRTQAIRSNTVPTSDRDHGLQLLQSAVQKQGLDRLATHTTYHMTGTDHWRGMMGKMGNPWNWNNQAMTLRYSVGDFDGQVEVLEGKRAGFIAGLQSWNYYEVNQGRAEVTKADKGLVFILAAFHYFAEMGQRLAQAPYIAYAGEDALGEMDVDKVFVSWGTERTKAYDQYVVWIGKESGLIEAVEFTTRDVPGPAPSFIYGSLQFDDFRDVDGVLVPFQQSAQMGSPKAPAGDYLHQFNVTAFAFDEVELEVIRPLEGVEVVGDVK